MSMYLHPHTALGFWLTLDCPLTKLESASAADATNFAPSNNAAEYLAQRYPHIPFPYHVLVGSGRRNNTEAFHFHRLSDQWESVPFYQVAPGIFAPSPEATLASLGLALDFHELVYIGRCLCGDFALSPRLPGELIARKAVSSPELMDEFILEHPGFYGLGPFKRAILQIDEGAESPPEAFMAMALGLPLKRGGFNLKGLMCNYELLGFDRALKIAGSKSLRPDITIARNEKVVVFEYDSDRHHLSKKQAVRDEARRLGLEAEGVKVISIRPATLESPFQMTKIAGEAMSFLGLRRPNYPKTFARAQTALFRMDRSFSKFLIRPQAQ